MNDFKGGLFLLASSVFVSETELNVLLLLLSRNHEMEDECTESIEEEDLKRKRRQYTKLDMIT